MPSDGNDHIALVALSPGLLRTYRIGLLAYTLFPTGSSPAVHTDKGMVVLADRFPLNGAGHVRLGRVD
jgi:hypothetical protein